ncbi:hypothetical protein L1049_012717 [Liquidambar formosana]|uniref:Glabrous enhancer-binding protein-like DBD domain-containing protein n=1 Tax=Liquidambar formosana TaxID=63359 RepID=A0AAP0RJA1_LIQFO
MASHNPKSRFQRIFTEKDERGLLKALFNLTKSTRFSTSSTNIASPIYNLIAKSLSAEFSHGQITDKLRRLRQKYHKQARTKSLIKTPHDRKIYELARKIWGKNSLKKRNSSECGDEPKIVSGVWAARKEEGNLWDFPGLMGEISWLPENEVWREGLRCLESAELKGLNEKWILQQMEEAEVLAKMAELVHEQTKLILEAVVTSRNRC